MGSKQEAIARATQTLYRLMNKHTRLEALPLRLQGDTVVTHRELHVIEAIGDRSPLNITDLGAHFGVTKSAASQMVTKLVAKGLVKKAFAARNNKEYKLSLTPYGQEAFELHKRSHGEHMSDLVDRLGEFTVSQLSMTAAVLGVMEATVDDRIEQRLKTK